jgi:RNA polymerase sigma-70 factor (ECF subfamily)
MNILGNKEDAEECINDAYLAAWNAIPPGQPRRFKSYLGRIVRNLSLNRVEAQGAQKRGGHEMTLLLSELEQCIPSARNVEDEVAGGDLAREIDVFLSALKKESRVYFLCRYWYGYSAGQIAEKLNVGVSKVKVSLHRTRKKLRNYLEERGISV